MLKRWALLKQNNKHSDEERSGHQDSAFRVLFDMFHDRVYQTAYFVTKDKYLAQDVLQETFLKAFRNMDSVENGKNVGAWLSVIATNTAIDILRKRNRWNGIPMEDVILLRDQMNEETASTVEMEVERMFETDQVRGLIEQLKPEYRQVLLLKYIQGLRDREIAEQLGISAGTIKSRIFRAKRRLKDLLLTEDHNGRKTEGEPL